jgi:hypothetical protein
LEGHVDVKLRRISIWTDYHENYIGIDAMENNRRDMCLIGIIGQIEESLSS